MKKYTYTIALAIILAGAMVLVGCPTSGTNNNSGGGTTAEPCLVWGDGTYGASCGTVTLAATNPFGQDADGGQGNISLTLNSSGGTNGSDENYTIALTNAMSAWGVAFMTLNEETDFTGKTLTIGVKSPVTGGVGAIKVKLENLQTGAALRATNEVEKTFTNDDTWQEITWAMSDFTFPNDGLTQANIGKIVLVLSDANGAVAGLGVQTISFDEVRFE